MLQWSIAENFAVVGILVFHFGFDLEIIWQINCYHFLIVFVVWNNLKQLVFSMFSIFFFNISLIIPYFSGNTIDFIERQRLS